MSDELDVTAESSPVQANEPNEPSSNEGDPASAAASTSAEDNVPFHKHPRFQELIQERNSMKEQNAAFAKRLQEMEERLAKQHQPAPQKDELMERLKGIDPAFAERFGKIGEVDQLKQELAEFKQWREEAQAAQLRSQVQSSKDKFYTENNIPEERRSIYEALVQAEASKNPALKVSDLPNVLKKVHEGLGKMFQNVERTTTKNFVDGKKNEAAKPASLPKGAPAQAKRAEQSSLSRAEILAQMRDEVLAEARANKDI